MYTNKKEKFIYNANYIDSVYVFDDGDFILFGIKLEADKFLDLKKKSNPDLDEKSKLFSGKTFKQKMVFKITSKSCFYNLSNNEFAISCGFTHFEICKFNSDRTKYEIIQFLGKDVEGTCMNIGQLSNGDIFIIKLYLYYYNIYIYRKSENNEKYQLYGNNYLYLLEGLQNIINLNDKEVLTYKKNILEDSLELKIYSNDDYKIKKQNEIKFKDKIAGTRIYLASPLIKINENKMLSYGANNLYIFDLDSLELDTIIQFEKPIIKLLIRPAGNLFLFTENQETVSGNTSFTIYIDKKYCSNIKIDFETNDLISNTEEDITNYCGEKKNIFYLDNYINNGLISLIDKNKLIIYENCDNSI